MDERSEEKVADYRDRNTMTPAQPFHDVRMKGFRDRTEVAEVLRLLDERASPLTSEAVPLAAAAGRVLAEGIVAPVDVPGFARAAMDGFAVRGEDTFGADTYNPLPLSVLGEAFPARPYAGVVGPGQAVRIMTGAPVPTGANAVLMAESAELDAGGTRVLARDAVTPGRRAARAYLLATR
jgi:molybdopterin molybdotransferase